MFNQSKYIQLQVRSTTITYCALKSSESVLERNSIIMIFYSSHFQASENMTESLEGGRLWLFAGKGL